MSVTGGFTSIFSFLLDGSIIPRGRTGSNSSADSTTTHSERRETESEAANRYRNERGADRGPLENPIADIPKLTLREHYDHHQDMQADVISKLSDKGYTVESEISFRDSCGKGRCRPDIIFRSPTGKVFIYEIKTGNADLSLRQSQIFPQIRNGDAIPTGKVAKRLGLILGVPLREQGYPNGIRIRVLRFPGAGK